MILFMRDAPVSLFSAAGVETPASIRKPAEAGLMNKLVCIQDGS
jgi:hypothetical protein